jgi:hypothetical protein
MGPGGPNGISRRTLHEQSSEPELPTGHVPGREKRKAGVFIELTEPHKED